MHRFSIVLVILCVYAIQAHGQAVDSVIRYRHVSAVLNERSGQNSDGKRYMFTPIPMNAGDQVLVVYRSNDFATALLVKDSAGHSAINEDKEVFNKVAGSRVSMPFRADVGGVYRFFFTTREKGATGAFTADLYLYNNAVNKVTSASSFCDKLRYVVANDYLGFDFLKGTQKEGVTPLTYEPRVVLVPEARCQIVRNTDDAYICTWAPTGDLKDIQARFDGLSTAIASCLPAARKKVYTAETSPEAERKAFVSRIDFTEQGVVPGDLQAAHASPVKIKYSISLRLLKVSGTTYGLMLKVN